MLDPAELQAYAEVIERGGVVDLDEVATILKACADEVRSLRAIIAGENN